MDKKPDNEWTTVPSGAHDLVAQDLTGREIASGVKYRIKRSIARGGMGAIYDAEQSGVEGFSKRMAIKILLPELSSNHEFVSMFIGEARLVADLVHQNIVQIYQLGRSGDNYFIAMEFIDGIDLEQFMNRHMEIGEPIPVDIATYIVSRICRGLEYAHNKKDEKGERLDIVHRDVSPKNIMITNEGEIKLGDFGVAKARSKAAAHLKDDILVGKVPYMSPEQATYQPTDARSDVFSLGAVFYELLTNVRVFERESDEDTVNEIVFGRSPDPRLVRPDVPAEVAVAVMRSLERDIEDRFQSAGDLGYELEKFMYSKGYGPTIVTMAKYAQKVCPDRKFYLAPSKGDDLGSTVNR